MVSLLVIVVLVALVFDYINGFHDAANAIATVVSTGVLPIRTAVLIAGVLNFFGAMWGTAVAKTIASGLAEPADATQVVVLAALLGACAWNIITWYYGIPSSSSHALIGGLAGAVVAHGGLGHFKWLALKQKVLVPLVVSPLVGFILAFALMITLLWIIWLAERATRIASPARVARASRWMQLGSASAMAWAHGTNDAQKSMGIITLALMAFASSGRSLPQWVLPSMGKTNAIPFWVIASCALSIGLGTMAGGKRIIKTMGTKIIRIAPLQGFAAETAGAATIIGASSLGVPISTTHCINACIMGVGASKRLSAVRWGVAGNIVLAWVLTLPVSGALSLAAYWGLRALFSE